MSTSKTAFLNRVYSLLKKKYGRKKEGTSRSVLEEAIFAVLAEDANEPKAGKVFRRFTKRYVDWNEVRVSSLHELSATMAGLPDTESKGTAMKNLLEYVFSDQHDLTLDMLQKAPLKKAARYLKRSDGLSDFVVASVTLLSLGGHAVPVDAQMHRVMHRFGLSAEDTSVEELRGSVERLVAKNRAYAFWRLMTELAQDTCGPKTPRCGACVLAAVCPTGMDAVGTTKRTRTTTKRKTASPSSSAKQSGK